MKKANARATTEVACVCPVARNKILAASSPAVYQPGKLFDFSEPLFIFNNIVVVAGSTSLSQRPPYDVPMLMSQKAKPLRWGQEASLLIKGEHVTLSK